MEMVACACIGDELNKSACNPDISNLYALIPDISIK